ncbi:tyrosine-type recombinase/integrase [Acinetobacter guillouiae]|uniref:tyrosine-type recombinase/integrase n=1 Tax=Acinetobacter guillouiae TaxID=106649 RepID=UPI003AF793ED
MNETLSHEKKALSAKAIEKMKSGDKDKSDIGENAGLRVSCGKTGKKSFFYRYRSPIDDLIKQYPIGVFPEVTLSEARVKLKELKIERRKGICPKARLEQEKIGHQKDKAIAEQKKERDTFTVQSLVDLYLDGVICDRQIIDSNTGSIKFIKGARKPKGQSETRRTLYTDVVKILGDVPAIEVTKRDVVTMINNIINRGSKVQGGRVLAELNLAYEYAIGIGRLPEDFPNPAILAKASFKQSRIKLTAKKGTRYLVDDEIKRVLKWLPMSGFSLKHKQILQIAFWTGCRTGEICSAEWCDVNFDLKTWYIKATKNETARYVQLSDECVAYLKRIYESHLLDFSGVLPKYIFFSSSTQKPILQKTLSETKWRLKNPEKIKNHKYSSNQVWLTEIDDWSPHDIRRTVRTGLSRLGCPKEVAEAILGHSKKGIEGVYDLHEYETECAIWLQKWSNHLFTILEN